MGLLLLIPMLLSAAVLLVNPAYCQDQQEYQLSEYDYTSSVPRELIPVMCLFFAGFILLVCMASFAVFCFSDAYCSSSLGQDDDLELSDDESLGSTGPADDLKSKLLEDSQRDGAHRGSGTASSKRMVSQDMPETVTEGDADSVIINLPGVNLEREGATSQHLPETVTHDGLESVKITLPGADAVPRHTLGKTAQDGSDTDKPPSVTKSSEATSKDLPKLANSHNVTMKRSEEVKTKHSISKNQPELMTHYDSHSVIINMEPCRAQQVGKPTFLLQQELTNGQFRLTDKGVTSISSSNPVPQLSKQMVSSLLHQDSHHRLKNERNLYSSPVTTYLRG